MISIITPSFNQGQYIERTIQSVLSQSISSPAYLEYIIIDGGSRDNTIQILNQYSHASPLRFISEKDRGQAHAVNKGLQLSSGDIIGWLNSDDIYYPHAVQTILDLFAQHPDVDVIYGQANHIDQQDQFLERYPTKSWHSERLKQTCFISQPAVFFRRRLLERFGLLDETLHYCMDYEYWLRLALNGVKFLYLEKILAGSRLYPETKTLSAPEKATLEAMNMLQKKLKYIPMSWLITYAIVCVKSKTRLRMPQWRYVITVIALGIISAFRWNGFWMGIKSCLSLPASMKIFFMRRC